MCIMEFNCNQRFMVEKKPQSRISFVNFVNTLVIARDFHAPVVLKYEEKVSRNMKDN